jgi:6-methylsalicylate decarboxylase
MLWRTCEFSLGGALDRRLSRRLVSNCLSCQRDATALSRRAVLSSLATSTIAAPIPGTFAATPAAVEEPALSLRLSFIDVHHHYVPPAYMAENRNPVSAAALDWHPQKAHDAMDGNVATAVLSLPLPAFGSGTRKQVFTISSDNPWQTDRYNLRIPSFRSRSGICRRAAWRL